ncbi:MAG: hypothetical protein J6L58_04865 [Clostridia bacterium]|nr:hypothetical protein [Clostridia bacterium]
MVKGVNKQIIEINDTGSKYFEKVLLFVVPGKKDLPNELLQKRAKEYVVELSKNITPALSIREQVMKKRAKRRLIVISSIVIIISVAAAVIINIL